MVNEATTLDNRFYNYLSTHLVKRNIALAGERLDYGTLAELGWFTEYHLKEKTAFETLLALHRLMIELKLNEMQAIRKKLAENDLDIWTKREALLDLMVLDDELEVMMLVYQRQDNITV